MAGNEVTLDELAERMEAQTSWLDMSDYYQPCLCRL
jgi:hypothetical protein